MLVWLKFSQCRNSIACSNTPHKCNMISLCLWACRICTNDLIISSPLLFLLRSQFATEQSIISKEIYIKNLKIQTMIDTIFTLQCYPGRCLVQNETAEKSFCPQKTSRRRYNLENSILWITFYTSSQMGIYITLNQSAAPNPENEISVERTAEHPNFLNSTSWRHWPQKRNHLLGVDYWDGKWGNWVRHGRNVDEFLRWEVGIDRFSSRNLIGGSPKIPVYNIQLQ